MTVAAWNAGLSPRWRWWRLLPALGLSVLVHALIVDNWRPTGGARPVGAVPAPLQAWLETAEPLALPAVDEADVVLEPDPVRAAAGAHTQISRVTPATPVTEGAPVMAGNGASVPDPRFYQARELDRYPLPLAPLNLQAAPEQAGSVRLWLSINSQGYVVDVAVGDADPTGALESMARASLLAMRFMPAVKNGHPVKSRILLELRYGH